MKTFSQIAMDAIAILTRLGADKEPTRSQLLYAAKQALRRDGVKNPPASLYLPVMHAIEHELNNIGIACQAEAALKRAAHAEVERLQLDAIPIEVEEPEGTEPTQVDESAWCRECCIVHEPGEHIEVPPMPEEEADRPEGYK